jgi:hypothetical protein
MTETDESATIAEALAFIDRGLGDMTHRTIVPTSEVADLLLDVRVILATAERRLTELEGAAAR